MTDPAHELRLRLRQLPAGRDLECLLDAALEQAELSGIRVLARTVPHELAQPLAEVRGYAELLAEGAYPEEDQREFLQRISSAAARAGSVAHAIARLGRVDQPSPQRRTLGGEDLLLIPAAAEPSA